MGARPGLITLTTPIRVSPDFCCEFETTDELARIES